MDNNKIPKFKILLLGDSKVGKTSLIKRYCSNIYENSLSTIGFDLFEKNYKLEDGTNIKVHIWDTAGQERFKSITKSIFKNADGVLLLYDITDQKTYDNVTGWIKDIKNLCLHHTKIVLIGNKCDLIEDRVITKEESERFAEKVKVSLYEISCKDSINIEEPFNDVIKQISVIKKDEITNYKLEVNKQQIKKKECCS